MEVRVRALVRGRAAHVRALVRGHTCGLTEKANPDCESLSKVTEQPSKCIMLERESKQTNKKANTHTR
jgi:hypothetical protein